MIRHIVLLRFKDGVSEQTKQTLYDDLEALKNHIPGILGFHAGPNASVEAPMIKGYKDAFWCDFADAKVRDVYLEDPVHQTVGGRLVAEMEGGTDGIVVFDMQV